MKYKTQNSKKKVGLLKPILIFFTIFIFCLIIFSGFKQISNSDFFIIKKVKIKGDIGWLENSVKFLIGKNLFSLDLKKAKKILISQNPEIERLNITKLWPDTVLIRFILKQPLAIMEGGQLLVDKNGFLLERNKFKGPKIDKLPLISGIPSRQFAVRNRLISEQWRSAFELINSFSNEPALYDYQLIRVDVKQISENSLFIKRKSASLDEQAIMVKIGEGPYLDKLKMFEIFLKKANIDWSRVNYIDLRFKEPIIGLRND